MVVATGPGSGAPGRVTAGGARSAGPGRRCYFRPVGDNELGAFLRARRESLAPPPTGARRRTPGWRRSEVATSAGVSVEYLIRLEQGQPITFGADQQYSVTHPAGGFGLKVVEGGEAIVHDATVDDPAYAFALSRLSGSDLGTTPIGVFRDVRRPSYDELIAKQLFDAKAQADGTPEQMLDGLLHKADTWTIL